MEILKDEYKRAMLANYFLFGFLIVVSFSYVGLDAPMFPFLVPLRIFLVPLTLLVALVDIIGLEKTVKEKRTKDWIRLLLFSIFVISISLIFGLGSNSNFH